MQTLTRRFYGRLTLAWVAVMLVLTLTPAQDMPRTPEWKLLSFDTAAHAGVFAVLAGLGWLWARRVPRLARYAGGWVLLSCAVFGGLIEILQYLMNMGRHAEWTDLLGDTIGAALVLAGAGLAGRGRRAAPVVGLLLATGLAHAQAPDLARARRTIAALAAPAMHGRGYVRQGEHRAAAYLRDRLRQLGLQPLAPDYTQSFTLDVNTFPGELQARLTGRNPHTLRPGRDFIAAPESGPAKIAREFRAWPLDTLIFTDTAAVRRYTTGLSGMAPGVNATPWVNGYLPTATVMRARDEARLPTLPAELQKRLAADGPRLILVPKLTASLAGTQVPQLRFDILASQWPIDPAGSLTAQTIRLQADAHLIHNYQTQNLAALIKGTTQPDSFLVVSAHYDHLGMMGSKTYFPGANDNASGVALLLELAAHYAQPVNRPACSVVFLLFGAEEAGLVGSSYFVQHPLVPLARIKFLLNLDLLGTGEEGATVVNGRVYPAAYARLTALNDAHHYLPRLTARGRAANSDHFPFSEAGVPAFFIYTRGGSVAYHDVYDQPAALSLAGFAGAFGLARDFLDELGGR